MKTTKAWFAAVLAVLALAGCDPFEEDGDLPGAPRLLRAVAFDSQFSGENIVAEAADGGVAVLSGLDVATQNDDDPTTPEDESLTTTPKLTIVELQFSALLDGSSVQARAPDPVTGEEDCTPVGLAVTPPAPANTSWFTCYDSSSAASDHRGRIFVFRNAVAPTLDTPAPDPGDFTLARLDPNVAYRITGSVRSASGAQIPVDVTVNTVDTPNAAKPRP